MTTDGYPYASVPWGEGAVNAGTSGALVQLYEPPANGQDEVFAWADTTGQIYAAPFSHKATSISFSYAATAFTGTYTPVVCRSGPVRICVPKPPAENLVPSNAHVTGLSRMANQVDLFFVDAQGNARNAWSSDGGRTWNNLILNSDGLGVPGSPIAAVARTANNLDVFYLGRTGLEHASWNPGQGWTASVVPNTSSIAPAGGHVTAVAQSVDNVDAFWIDTNGALERASAILPSQQPTPVVSPVSAGGVGHAGGPVASVSRKPGVIDVVFQAPSSAASAAPLWYSLGTNGTWTNGALPGGDATEDISIVAPSSYELRVFMKTVLSDIYTTDWISSGVPSWTPVQGIETLGYITVPVHIPLTLAEKKPAK
jgi:hypothetical protein